MDQLEIFINVWACEMVIYQFYRGSVANTGFERGSKYCIAKIKFGHKSQYASLR